MKARGTASVRFAPDAEDVVGVVLAGGLSSRMGKHKAAIRLYGEDAPDLLSRTVELLRSCVGEVWISCRSGQEVKGCRCIPDVREDLGPLGGIVSVLRELRPGQAALILSCDLPFMEAAVPLRLISVRARSRAAGEGRLMTTFIQMETGFIEALVAVYEQAALPFFEHAMENGIRQINLVLAPEQRTDLPYMREEALPFFNINYPADLETARRLIAALHPKTKK